MTVRLTRYAPEGRGDAFADTPVDFGDFAASGIESSVVGTLRYNGKTSPCETPLYLLKVPLNTDLILDLLTKDKRGMWGAGDYLDLELARKTRGEAKRWGSFPCDGGYCSTRFRADNRTPGALQVFAVTLEAGRRGAVLREPALGQCVLPGGASPAGHQTAEQLA